MPNHHETNEQTLKIQEFRAQQEAMDIIYADREHGLANLFNELSGEETAQLFSAEEAETDFNYEECTCCIDEGVKLTDHQLPAARFAGSGILLGEQRAKDLWRQNNVTKVTAHTSCGAALLYCRDILKLDNITQAEADQKAADVLKQWAQDQELEFEYIAKLDRPHFHNARGVFVDATQVLKPQGVSRLPRMFEVSATASADEVAQDIKLAFAIATGDHGLQDLISAEQPFVIAFVGSTDDEFHFNEVLAELQKDNWLTNQQGRVMVQEALMDFDMAEDEVDFIAAD